MLAPYKNYKDFELSIPNKSSGLFKWASYTPYTESKTTN